MDEQTLQQLVDFGREQRGVEFKGPGSVSDSGFFARVALAVLAMSNRRDGGIVAIGIEDSGGTLKPRGLNPDDLATWRYDDVADKLHVYADPSVEFDLEIVELQGMSLVVITVHEFEEIPTVCAKSYGTVLHEGAVYVRPRRKPESVRVGTHADMRDLLDLAVDKALERFIRRVGQAGLTLPKSPPAKGDQDKFDEQERDF